MIVSRCAPDNGCFPCMQCLSDSWSLTYTSDWWRYSFCPGLALCDPTLTVDVFPAACNMYVPSFPALDLPWKDTLLATNCNFTTAGPEATDVTTRAQMCSCLSTGTLPDASSVTQVFNSLLYTITVGSPDTPPAGPTPNTCPTAFYTDLLSVYVCSSNSAINTCPCPTDPVTRWNSSASNVCRQYLADSLDSGKCLPANSSSLLPGCMVQQCECAPVVPGTSPSPSPAPPSPSPSPAPPPSPSPSPSPVPSPSPSPPAPVCLAPPGLAANFSAQVQTNAIVGVAYGGDVVGYFRHTFLDCDPQSILCTGSTYKDAAGNYVPGTYQVIILFSVRGLHVRSAWELGAWVTVCVAGWLTH